MDRIDRIGNFRFTAALWRHPGPDAWHFVRVPEEESADIRDLTAGARRGFGSVRVAVTVGSTSWRTSVFPQAGTGCYLLPVKKAVRTAEHLQPDDPVPVRLELLDL